MAESNGLYSGKHGNCTVVGRLVNSYHRQDLNSSILVGSKRIVDHTTFAELHWSRDPFSAAFYRLPPGFQNMSHLTKDFIEVLKDINALNCIRDLRRFSKRDVMQMAHLNNHTAWIQSRLVALPNPSLLLECCHLVAYLCSVMLCCTVWCGLVVPVSALQILFRPMLSCLIFTKCYPSFLMGR